MHAPQARWSKRGARLPMNTLKGHRAGVENFSNFGKLHNLSDYETQSHEVGPVFKGDLTDQLSYETGYRYGFSDTAPDHTFRLFLVQRF